MWPFDRRPPEERFWRWFQKNSDRLFRFETDQERVFEDLSGALRAVDRELTFEFGPIREGRRELVVSADGIRKSFPAVRRLVAAAPPLSRWIVTPFRPPASLDVVIQYAGVSLGPDDIWFTAEPDGEKSAGFILLDNALGEFAVETQVGFVEWKPLPDDPATDGLSPFRSIRDTFDTVSH
jgi:hypothetical protein